MDDRDYQSARDEFGNLPGNVRIALWKAGVRSQHQLRRMTDAELMDLQGIGEQRVRLIRLEYPHEV